MAYYASRLGILCRLPWLNMPFALPYYAGLLGLLGRSPCELCRPPCLAPGNHTMNTTTGQQTDIHIYIPLLGLRCNASTASCIKTTAAFPISHMRKIVDRVDRWALSIVPKLRHDGLHWAVALQLKSCWGIFSTSIGDKARHGGLSATAQRSQM